jgi:hypothetical protein
MKPVDVGLAEVMHAASKPAPACSHAFAYGITDPKLPPTLDELYWCLHHPEIGAQCEACAQTHYAEHVDVACDYCAEPFGPPPPIDAEGDTAYEDRFGMPLPQRFDVVQLTHPLLGAAFVEWHDVPVVVFGAMYCTACYAESYARWKATQ